VSRRELPTTNRRARGQATAGSTSPRVRRPMQRNRRIELGEKRNTRSKKPSSETQQQQTRRHRRSQEPTTQRRRSVVVRDHQTARRGGLPRRRLIAALVVVLVGLVAVLLRVGAIQTAAMGEEFRVEGARQWTRTISIPAGRGSIFDRNGEELAMSVAASTISINPKLIAEPEGTLATLTSILQLSQDKQAELREAMATRDRGFVYVARQVDESLGQQIAALRLSGVDVVREDRRTLPGGVTGRSVIGRTDIDGVGIAGLELQFDELLTGEAGQMTRERAPGGRSIPGSDEIVRQPVPGDDLVLTLDRSIQFSCEQALIEQVERIGARGATCIVMDTPTGEIYAMASVRRNETTGQVEVASGNFSVVDADEPGSVAKVITTAAALDAGVVRRDSYFNVPWREQYYDDLLSDAWQHPEETWNVDEILIRSSNIGTIKIWERLGRERHWNYMRAFGLGEASALGFPGESPGILKHWKDLWGSERVTVSYGQGMASTSIQLAAAVNVIANNGVYVAPKLVAATVGADGELTRTPPSATHAVVSAETAAQMREVLAAVVCQGTATAAATEGFTVAGKTGTGLKAQPNGTYTDAEGNRVYYASFAGFFPAEAPAVTLLISVDEPPAGSQDRFGGTAAAPVFGALAPSIVHELGIEPPPVKWECRQ